MSSFNINDVIKKSVRYILGLFNLAITTKSNLIRLEKLSLGTEKFDLRFISSFPNTEARRLIELLPRSRSQLRQDLFVLANLNFKRNGFFVEFGASDGLSLSNSFLLESEFGWTGILAEPALVWQNNLKINRPSSIIEQKCVWTNSHSFVELNETRSPEYSTIDEYSSRDSHSVKRLNGKKYQVETISLSDLLEKHNAPKVISYISIDTEGSEFEILRAFDFTKYRFDIITIEHNFSKSRTQIEELLRSHDYIRKFEDLSQFDDWYIHKSLVD